jgi:integrase
MASVHRKDGEKTWQVFWRDPGGKQHAKRGFATKRDANAYGVRMEASKLDCSYVDATLGRESFGSYAKRWASNRLNLRESTQVSVATNLGCHYGPINHRPMASITKQQVQDLVACWIGEGLKPRTVRKLHQLTSAIFSAAVDELVIARSPCTKVSLPALDLPPVKVMSAEQVAAMASAVSDRYRALILLAAGTGMRQGECLGLSLDRIDWMRRTITVDRQLITVAGKPPEFGPLKGQGDKHRSRVLVVPDALLSALGEHVGAYPVDSDGLVFTDAKGDRIRRNAAGHVWRRAATKAGVTGHSFHDLRHFCASGLIAAGLSVVAVQHHLGHSSASITLNVYAHLWPSDGEATRVALSGLFGAVISRPVSAALAEEISS